MANEPRVPEVRDDDPEEVADKLSIASAMWSRGDRADALTWLRRAAESASDAEQDMRALELAKAASELASLGNGSQGAVAAAAPASAPEPPPASQPAPTSSAAPPPRPKTAPPPKPSVAPPKPSVAPAAGRAPAAAASSLPKKPAPAARPPGSKLPPLPPMRPLGTPAAAPAKPARLPSMITSAMGATTASGTVQRDDTPPPPEAGAPMPWDDQSAIDDEPTKQIALTEDASAHDLEETREIAAIAMQPAREEPREAAPASAPVAHELPLAVGVRVRVLVAADGVHIVPEGETTSGVAAVIMPLDANDDLRALFQRRA